MNLEDALFQRMADIRIPHFFVTVEITQKGESLPADLETFLRTKHRSIQEGAGGRKFIYSKEGWRLIFTFFPTDRVVDERYALKNKTQFKHHL